MGLGVGLGVRVGVRVRVRVGVRVWVRVRVNAIGVDLGSRLCDQTRAAIIAVRTQRAGPG